MITIHSLEQNDALVAELEELRPSKCTLSQMAAGTLVVSAIVNNRSELCAYIKPDGRVSRPRGAAGS